MKEVMRIWTILLLLTLFIGYSSAISSEPEFNKGEFNLTTIDTSSSEDQVSLGYSSEDILDSLEAFWGFDGNLLDYSANEIDPVSSNSVTFEEGILSGSSAVFRDSKRAYIEYPDSAGLNQQKFTLSAWVKPKGSQDNVIVSKSGSADRGFLFLIENFNSKNRVSLHLRSPTDGLQRFRTDTKLEKNVWQHIAASFNGTDVSIYINGTKMPLYSGSSSASYEPSSQNLIVGASATETNADYYNGSIDALRVHSPPLTENNISREYFYGRPFQGEYRSKNFSSSIGVNWFQAETESLIPQSSSVNISLSTEQSTGFDTGIQRLSGGNEKIKFDLEPSKQAFFGLKGISRSVTDTWSVDKVKIDYLGVNQSDPVENETIFGGRVDFSYTVDSSVSGTAHVIVNGTKRKEQPFDAGQSTYTQYVDLNEGFYSSKIKLETYSGEEFSSETREFAHVNQTDFSIEGISVNKNRVIENASTIASVDISNLEPDPGKTQVQANFSHYRSGSWNQYNTSTEVFDSSGNDNTVIDFSFKPRMGPNRIVVKADPTGSVNESNETNNQLSITKSVPLYAIFYGEATQTTTLSDFENKRFYSFGDSDITGTVYYVDSDAEFSFGSLEPLKNYEDLQELDNSLNSTGFNDSIQNIWGGNNQISKTSCFTVSGTQECDIPSVNSTKNSFFDTGILYDGGPTYEEDDPVTFISDIVPSRQGKYGTYDYELKVPANLDVNSGPSEKLDVYIEIN